MITQRRLFQLLALVEHAHFGRAAERLNISQPALSKSIQSLEAELGVKLVDRKSGAVTLTVFGDLVVKRSKLLLTHEEDLRREIKLLAEHETGSLSVALGPYPSVISGYPGVARLHALYPNLRIKVHVTGWRDVVQQVLSRKVDLGIADISGLEANGDLVTEMVGQHRGRVFCRPNHPLLRQGQVSASQLLEFPWISSRIPTIAITGLPQSLGVAGEIDPMNGDFVPAIEIDVPIHLSRFLTGTDALVFAPLSIMANEFQAGDVELITTTDVQFQSGYGFIYLKSRSLAPSTLAYMQEVRLIEADFSRSEEALTAKLES